MGFIRTNATNDEPPYDLRKVDRYECDDEFDWEIQWQKEGERSEVARYLVRIGEMTESIKILQQAGLEQRGDPMKIEKPGVLIEKAIQN